ncbi:MAG: uracil-DNA glycosylase [Flavobacteriales bacterium]|nr:uracil-DNA glycosylase [Flavobacteriales bacterium]
MPSGPEPKANVDIDPQWELQLRNEFHSEYFKNLKQFLLTEKQQHTIFPPGKEIFSAFNLTPFSQVKAVILGQDPYHGKGQANGLCFSVSPGIKQPPSLKNIFKELHDDIGLPVPVSGDLSPWARQGVLLLNATLTVRASQPGSHQKQGWETFTDQVIRALSNHHQGLVFLLWGKFAQAKADLIDAAKHHILKAAHPSPYSATYGFFGCKHFSKTNELLKQEGKSVIDWSLP